MSNIRLSLLPALAALVLAVSAFGAVRAPSADAHRIISWDQAIGKVASIYRSHCGNGGAWICSASPSVVYGGATGVHSWLVEYHWQEIYVPTLNPRYCAVIARVEHDWVAEIIQNEWCWG